MTRKERMNTPYEQMGRVDIRAYIKRRIEEEGITIADLARLVDTNYSNLCQGLQGKFTIPIERMEKILWLLDGDERTI